jgi:O-antigen/teichoic acid export membrane protein
MNLKKILKSVAILSVSELISRAINFVSYAILARVFLADGFGLFSYIFAIISYITLFVNFGTDVIGNRDVARHKATSSDYLNKLLSFRIIVAIVFYLVFSITLLLANIEQSTKNALLIYGLTFISNAMLINWFFRGVEKNKYIAFAQIFSSCFGLLAVSLLIHSSSDFIMAIWIYTLSSFINAFTLIFFYGNTISKLNFNFDLAFIKKLIPAVAPIGISAIMINVYYNFDHILLGAMGYKVELGYYAAAYKIILVAIIPTSIIWQSFFPQLSGSVNDIHSRDVLMDNYSKIMFMLGVTITLFVIFFSDDIIKMVFGSAYYRSFRLLMILGINIILVFINMVYGNPLLAWNQQKKYSYVIGLGAISNIMLNIILIPKFFGYGAAIATITSEIVVFIGVLFLHFRSTKRVYMDIFVKCIIAGIAIFILGILCNMVNCPKTITFCIMSTSLLAIYMSMGLIKISFLKRFTNNEI